VSAFLIILGVPLLGLVLLLAEQTRRSGQTPRTRSLARVGVLLCGTAVGLLGGVVLADTAMWIASGVYRSILLAVVSFVTQSVAGLLMLWAGWCAWRVYSFGNRSSDIDSEPQYERVCEQLRLSAVLLMLVPMLLLGAFGVVLAVPLALWGVAFRTARIGRQAQFLWTLTLAVRQDLPLADEIELFAQPLWSKQREKYRTLANRLRDGRALGESLELSSGILSRATASEIRMAEETGQLPQVLADLATSTTSSLNRSRLDGSVALTVLYGWMLLSMFLVVVTFLMYWIIPKYKAIFEDFAVELPPMTRSVIHASDFFMEHFLLVMPLVGLPILSAIVISIVYFLSWGNLNLPLLMRWFPRLDAPSLLRTLSHAVAADQPLPRLVEEMSQRHLRSDVRLKLERISEALQRGEPLWTSLWNEGLIRRPEADALAAAQRAGNLPWAMRTLADGMDRSSRRRTQFWLEILKPAVVIGVGVTVGWFVIAMFLPLVQLIVALA
jgi:type II secretory pathway component PulF